MKKKYFIGIGITLLFCMGNCLLAQTQKYNQPYIGYFCEHTQCFLRQQRNNAWNKALQQNNALDVRDPNFYAKYDAIWGRYEEEIRAIEDKERLCDEKIGSGNQQNTQQSGKRLATSNAQHQSNYSSSAPASTSQGSGVSTTSGRNNNRPAPTPQRSLKSSNNSTGFARSVFDRATEMGQAQQEATARNIAAQQATIANSNELTHAITGVFSAQAHYNANEGTNNLVNNGISLDKARAKQNRSWRQSENPYRRGRLGGNVTQADWDFLAAKAREWDEQHNQVNKNESIIMEETDVVSEEGNTSTQTEDFYDTQTAKYNTKITTINLSEEVTNRDPLFVNPQTEEEQQKVKAMAKESPDGSYYIVSLQDGTTYYVSSIEGAKQLKYDIEHKKETTITHNGWKQSKVNAPTTTEHIQSGTGESIPIPILSSISEIKPSGRKVTKIEKVEFVKPTTRVSANTSSTPQITNKPSGKTEIPAASWTKQAKDKTNNSKDNFD